MKVVDTFMFFNELDLLEIRLDYLYNRVDHFVLVEAAYTQLGNPKPFYFEENLSRYSKYLDKIIHIKLDEEPQDKIYGAWTNENYQRNQITRGLDQLNLDYNDVVILSDLDEIPEIDAIDIYIRTEQQKPMSVVQDIYYYYLNAKAPFTWNGSQIFRYGTIARDGFILQTLRNQRDQLPKVGGGVRLGWHFAYMGGVDKVFDKINAICESWAHETHKDKEKLRAEIAAGNLYFNGNTKLTFVPLGSTFPRSITENKEKYKEMIHE